ncbi:16S rRNA (guanine(966)-N(2))-methyltransferase RsmD [Kytococcus sedentarius]|uniref:16S rRNA (guanine(966)-N(2))-methyltransferase RsmD n=1 Tax=Kytococcus sedentarius TaxID=1276 RepID=UPI001950F89C|nr:16S rRNA (guanine(966)-N(2))-methyltransferase RsmD [Kytococcus sedentarius]QRO88112.1 16S rRNA (guanine(966)-N(2))-methyltransferase RsmD [Kytococcus sedentarius]
MRIIAGSLGGRRIAAPRGADTRPTSDRVREALFSMLEHEGVLRDAWVLDMFAGSGALGLEAHSRGARRVDWVDSAVPAVATLRENLTALGVAQDAAAGVHQRSVLSFLRAGRRVLVGDGGDLPDGGRVVLALLDPPYPLSEEDLAAVLAALADDWLAPGAIVVVERSARSPEPTWPPGLERFRHKEHGETALWFAEPVDPRA